MPIYEYGCLKCKTDYSELVMSDEEEKKVKCPGCGSKKKERIFSSFGLVDNLSTNMPAPDLSGLPPQLHNQVQLSDYIEAKDLPKKNR